MGADADRIHAVLEALRGAETPEERASIVTELFEANTQYQEGEVAERGWAEIRTRGTTTRSKGPVNDNL